MRRYLSGATLVVVLAVAIGALRSSTLDGQEPPKPDQTNQKETSRGKVGADPNVKEAEGVNTRNQPTQLPGPADKTKEKTRQALCAVMFDNYTNLFVQTYVDGRYAGTIRPWGELHTYAVAGPTILYARAVYQDGTFDYWGPRNVSCTNRFRWRLDP